MYNAYQMRNGLVLLRSNITI